LIALAIAASTSSPEVGDDMTPITWPLPFASSSRRAPR
jgi:hypothetical protein